MVMPEDYWATRSPDFPPWSSEQSNRPGHGESALYDYYPTVAYAGRNDGNYGTIGGRIDIS